MDYAWSNSQQLQDRIIWVRSQAEAENYPMVPNATMQFWDIYQPVIYRKMTDQYGRTSLFEAYDLVKRPTQQSQQSMQQSPQPAQQPQYQAPVQQNANDYVNAAAFNSLVERVNHMGDMLAGLVEKSKDTAVQMSPPAHEDRRKDGNR